jgi:hypothetical protein
MGQGCDTFPFLGEGVQNLGVLDTNDMLKLWELTRHCLTSGLRLSLEVLSKAIWDEEVVDGSLVWGKVFSVGSYGSVEVVLKLAMLAEVYIWE